uniref:non-specific serine/threonine protein kinase n=1 Tax=Halisarca dujardinii TaxID=2583056 RepID=A0A6C0PMY8_HALDU|nr:serine/threonine-protein kinase mTOR [Halisarca dujardinii]
MERFIPGLKSRSDEERAKTARSLKRYVTTTLQECSAEDYNSFFDSFNQCVFELVSSSEAHEKKGAIVAIVNLIGLDDGNVTRISRFANYLRNILPNPDVTIMEMGARAIGRLALAESAIKAEYVEFEVKRALEFLGQDKSELKRHAAVLVLRELAVYSPTLFYQSIQQFFENIFGVVRDQKAAIREKAVLALRASLRLLAERESKEMLNHSYYRQTYDEAMRGVEEAPPPKEKGSAAGKDDRVHGSLLTIRELLLVSLPSEPTLRRAGLEGEDEGELDPFKMEARGEEWTHRQPEMLQLLLQGNSLVSRKLDTPTGWSKGCKQLITRNFTNICPAVLKYRASRNPLVQQAVLHLIPRLASFNPQQFSQRYLKESMQVLLASVKKEKEKAVSFRAIGLVAFAVKEDILPFLEEIFNAIRLCLPVSRDLSKNRPSRGGGGAQPEAAIFPCVSLLTHALGPQIQPWLQGCLEPMFSLGLSAGLTAALEVVAEQVPALEADIQSGVLRMLSLVLLQQQLKHPGSPRTSVTPGPQTAVALETDVAMVTLALRTLGSFNFGRMPPMQFVASCAEGFLTHEHREVRLAAVRSCAALLAPMLSSASILEESFPVVSTTTNKVLADVLAQMLTVGITDQDDEVRLCVLSTLDARFNAHLSQPEAVTVLFIALHDKKFHIREGALATIGRLSNLNPAFVLPSLRKVLIQILTELEYSGIGKNREQSTRLLRQLITEAPDLVKPYKEAILKVLIPKLKDSASNPSVLTCILIAIGELAVVSGRDMRAHADDLLPIILDLLQDSSSSTKRAVALYTLGRLVEYTGYVVEPYLKYTDLLGILLNFLKSGSNPAVRKEVIRVLGLLGALDPYKHKHGSRPESKTMPSKEGQSPAEGKALKEDSSEVLVTIGNPEELYPTVAIASLMRILKDQSLFQHHHMVIQSLAFIFKSQGIKSVPYLPQIMPPFVNAIRTCDPAFREFLFQQLGSIISIIKQHARAYMNDVLIVIGEFWSPNSQLQNTIILLIEQIVVAMGDELKAYFPSLVHPVLKLFIYDQSKQRIATQKMLKALQMCGANLDDYLPLLIHHIVKCFDTKDNPIDLKRVAMETIQELSDTLNFSDYSSVVVHGLVQVLETSPDLRDVAMDTLCCLVVQMGHRFKVFIPMASKVTSLHKITNAKYEMLLQKLNAEETLVWEEEMDRETRQRGNLSNDIEPASYSNKMHVAVAGLHRAWQTTGRASKDDWVEWLRRLGVELLKESPHPALRSCWALAQNYNPLSRELFNAAFVSCWMELVTGQQEDLVANLKVALSVPGIPEITQTLLNLAEFMEHCEEASGPLPLSATLLGECAMSCRAYAKALHYKELEFHKGPSTKILESLISINNKLQQPDAAEGVLEYALTEHQADLRVQEEWYESLHDWEQAHRAYEKKQYVRPDDRSLKLGRMRCLDALGEWEKLYKLSFEYWETADDEIKRSMARMSAAAAWGLGQWAAMEQYVGMIAEGTVDGSFYRAVTCVQQGHYPRARELISVARDVLDTELTALVGESYNRAYGALIQVQLLSELEEVIHYKTCPERQSIIREAWCDRLQGTRDSVEDWERILRVHSLVLRPEEHVQALVKYASICRKAGRMAMSHRTLVELLGSDPTHSDTPLPATRPLISYAFIKHTWHAEKKTEAYKMLTSFVTKSLHSEEAESAERNSLLSRCYRRLGDWQVSLSSDLSPREVTEIIESYHLATRHNPRSYKAWHAWAFMNYEALNLQRYHGNAATPTEGKAQQSSSIDMTISYACAAVHGFFKSIALSVKSSLQDTLRLLTLWFDLGYDHQVHRVLSEGIKTLDRNTWLQVVPQLIARIDSAKELISSLIHDLLADVGKQHPQALIYPLTVATKSASPLRKDAANRILSSMSEHSSLLVQQARMVSEELIRVAILWHEQWHEALEEASRLYFGDSNVRGMLLVLAPLHLMMEKGPETLKESSFNHAYGRDLADAQDWCRKYRTSNSVKDLNQAWDLYYHVFRRISKQLPQLTTLELQYVSPRLLSCTDLELAVPGTYDPSAETIRIQSVAAALQVITSKQRPRKLRIYGSNGNEYMFLLKGHEDLRQDERVMQLFGLVNTLLATHRHTFKRHLRIQQYSVIPLSQNSGLIGWVPHCDTLHALIRDYRERKKIMLNVEHRLMLQMTSDYDKLSLLQKVEVFEHGLDNTSGDDLAKVLWLKSPNSEVWFDRRTNYTRSLAVMSMVGYVLGLGDRHPSNLMLDRTTGHAVHIDFGDCFEVAMTREKFPEKIPFRLTRMLVMAMEVTGIEGNFRVTCNAVMSVLRQNKDSLMAVLEAFVYDPLLNWRLVDDPSQSKKSKYPLEENTDGPSEGHYPEPKPEELNKKALQIIQRVRDKLTGNDFPSEKGVDVPRQVQLLIDQATAHDHLCQCYIGWCPFW